ncbi:TetR/AcrR family transcriptional regulator, partial [Cellulomonas cellasea]
MPAPQPATPGGPSADLDVREQLIRGALALITDEGPVDLSVRRLAKAADRTTMCVYTKFTNRQGLLEAVYQRAGEELLAHLEPHVRDGALATADAYVARARLDAGRYALLLGQPLAALGIPDAARVRLVADLGALLVRALEADGLPTPAASA